MIPFLSGVRVWLATGHTDMRKGFANLSLLVQEVLRRDPLVCLNGPQSYKRELRFESPRDACTQQNQDTRRTCWVANYVYLNENDLARPRCGNGSNGRPKNSVLPPGLR